MAANLRPTLPGCASVMARNLIRTSIMYDETVYRATCLEFSPVAGVFGSYLGPTYGSAWAGHPGFTISA
jgi:hypothetical protein